MHNFLESWFKTKNNFCVGPLKPDLDWNQHLCKHCVHTSLVLIPGLPLAPVSLSSDDLFLLINSYHLRVKQAELKVCQSPKVEDRVENQYLLAFF